MANKKFKIYYHPETLQIKGMSYEKDVMQFPYLTSDIEYHSALDLSIEKINGKPTLKAGGLWEGSNAEKMVQKRITKKRNTKKRNKSKI